MIKGKEFYELFEATKKGCNKECNTCEMFVSTEKQCIHELDKKVKIWQKKQKMKFQEVLNKES